MLERSKSTLWLRRTHAPHLADSEIFQTNKIYKTIESTYFVTGRNAKLAMLKNSLLFQMKTLPININIKEFCVVNRELFSAVSKIERNSNGS